MSLLNRLFLPTKFLILGLVALLMVAVPTGLYLQSAVSEVAFSQKESQARDAVVILNTVVQFTQAHRGLSAGALGGNEALAQRRPDMRDKVARNIELLEQELKSIQASGELQQQIADIRQRWSALEQGVSGKSLQAAQSTQEHTALINQVLVLNEHLLAEFGLSLDPATDTYFLIQASLVNMPWLG